MFSIQNFFINICPNKPTVFSLFTEADCFCIQLNRKKLVPLKPGFININIGCLAHSWLNGVCTEAQKLVTAVLAGHRLTKIEPNNQC